MKPDPIDWDSRGLWPRGSKRWRNISGISCRPYGVCDCPRDETLVTVLIFTTAGDACSIKSFAYKQALTVKMACVSACHGLLCSEDGSIYTQWCCAIHGFGSLTSFGAVHWFHAARSLVLYASWHSLALRHSLISVGPHGS